MKDKIAILLSTYNGEKFLQEQIDSIINQTNQSWQLFIRDDGSTDKTLKILEEYTKNPKINWINKDKPMNLGVIKSFFDLLSNAEADYYMFCDQDDVWLPDKIELTLKKMKELETSNLNKPILVHTDLTVVDKDLNVISESMIKSQDLDPNATFGRLLVQNSITGCTVMINEPLKEACENIEISKVQMHDWWFALIASAFGEIGFVSKPTILYRQHGNNQVGAKSSFNELLTRKQLFKTTKLMLQKAMDQSSEFARQFPEIDNEKLNMIELFKDVTKFNPIKRYQLINRYGITKSGKGRNIFYLFEIMTW